MANNYHNINNNMNNTNNESRLLKYFEDRNVLDMIDEDFGYNTQRNYGSSGRNGSYNDLLDSTNNTTLAGFGRSNTPTFDTMDDSMVSLIGSETPPQQQQEEDGVVMDGLNRQALDNNADNNNQMVSPAIHLPTISDDGMDEKDKEVVVVENSKDDSVVSNDTNDWLDNYFNSEDNIITDCGDLSFSGLNFDDIGEDDLNINNMSTATAVFVAADQQMKPTMEQLVVSPNTMPETLIVGQSVNKPMTEPQLPQPIVGRADSSCIESVVGELVAPVARQLLPTLPQEVSLNLTPAALPASQVVDTAVVSNSNSLSVQPNNNSNNTSAQSNVTKVVKVLWVDPIRHLIRVQMYDIPQHQLKGMDPSNDSVLNLLSVMGAPVVQCDHPNNIPDQLQQQPVMAVLPPEPVVNNEPEVLDEEEDMDVVEVVAAAADDDDDNEDEDDVVVVPPAPAGRRPRGRPRKYMTEEESKRAEREKNRIAANKSRAKKRKASDDLIDEVDKLMENRKQLNQVFESIVLEINGLKEELQTRYGIVANDSDTRRMGQPFTTLPPTLPTPLPVGALKQEVP